MIRVFKSSIIRQQLTAQELKELETDTLVNTKPQESCPAPLVVMPCTTIPIPFL